ncbi:hypothetical protein NKH14_06840 [Mesorhizobium sp. M1380]|uniref:hypothetical protein n=1 Tax=Mesorhizobium sp. M1380 TaxID=2957093 RepID=UPI003334E734
MSKITTGDTVRCIDTTGASRLNVGKDFVVRDVRHDGFLRLEGIIGSFRPTRFELVAKAQADRTPFGQVKAVTVNKSDIHHVLTQYVRFGLGINATVEKIVDKFPEAVELVLKHEMAA